MSASDAKAELRARLDAATEGSRDLDLAIELVTGRCDPSGYLLGDELHWNEPHEFGSTVAYEPLSQYLPSYTTSIDAALTLLPEYISYELTFSAAGDDALWQCRAWDWTSSLRLGLGNEWKAEGSAPLAIQICRAWARLP